MSKDREIPAETVEVQWRDLRQILVFAKRGMKGADLKIHVHDRFDRLRDIVRKKIMKPSFMSEIPPANPPK